MATDIIPTETPSFTLLIDPPGRDYEKTSAALLYTLAAWAELIDDINPHDPVNDIGELLGSLLTKPMETAGGLLHEKREIAG